MLLFSIRTRGAKCWDWLVKEFGTEKRKTNEKVKVEQSETIERFLVNEESGQIFQSRKFFPCRVNVSLPQDILKDSSRVPKITLGHSFSCNNRHHKLFLSSPGRGGMGMRGRGRGRIPMGPPGVPGMPPTGEFPQGMDERYPFFISLQSTR